MPSPIVGATRMAVVLAATSNLLAQTITAYQKGVPLVIDYVPLFQFVLWAIINTPPNFLWQDFLESTFPAYHVSPTREAVLAASSKGDADAALDKASSSGSEKKPLVEPRLNKGNTVVKMVLDQTLGAAANTILFSIFMHAARAAMHVDPDAGPEQSLQFLLSGLLPSLFPSAAPSIPGGGEAAKGAGPVFRAFDYSRVEWPGVWAAAKGEFAPIMVAGWKLWPLVSLVNFTLVQTIEGRSLVGGLAGVGWGVYMSLLASK
ncbi:protein transport protein YIF1 [Microdochium nivale]|nr:protein transport protein YIF1 [Microdochium nivale]